MTKKKNSKPKKVAPKRSLLDQKLDELERKLIVGSLKRHKGVLRQVSSEFQVNRSSMPRR